MSVGLAKAQHRFAARQQVLERFFEIAGVPGVRHIAADARVGHHEVDLARGIGGNDPPDQPEVGCVHADDPVEAVIIGPGDLAGPFGTVKRHPVLVEAPPGRRVDGISGLLGGDCPAP